MDGLQGYCDNKLPLESCDNRLVGICVYHTPSFADNSIWGKYSGSRNSYIVWIACATVSLFDLTYFYVKVYLGVRKRRLREISLVFMLVKTKLESKVAKSTVLLTATIIFSTFPAIVFYILVLETLC